jgi:5'-nucleotidase
MKKIKVLLTNDDGIHAPGLKALWEALKDAFDVSIIAPSTEKSAVGLGITIRDPIHIERLEWPEGARAWKVSGTPADCVRMGLSVILDAKPDLIISGINRGSNAGKNVLYSGTVGGTIEGALRGIPGVAFSCESFEKPDYTAVQPFVVPLIQHLLEHPLPQGTLLNVNFPDVAKILGVKFARQGQGFWIEDPDHRVHPEGHSYYWLGGKWHEMDEDAESDVSILGEHYGAAVPIHVSQLTHEAHFNTHKELFNTRFGSTL